MQVSAMQGSGERYGASGTIRDPYKTFIPKLSVQFEMYLAI